MFQQKFAHICEAVAGTYPEARFLFDKKDQVGIIMFHRSHILIQDNSTEESPDAVHLIFHHESSPKFVVSISLFVGKVWEKVTVGDNFMVNEETGECYSFLEVEDRPSKGTIWQ